MNARRPVAWSAKCIIMGVRWRSTIAKVKWSLKRRMVARYNLNRVDLRTPGVYISPGTRATLAMFEVFAQYVERDLPEFVHRTWNIQCRRWVGITQEQVGKYAVEMCIESYTILGLPEEAKLYDRMLCLYEWYVESKQDIVQNRISDEYITDRLRQLVDMRQYLI